jgi:NAD(P)H-hydrate epimerase
MVLLRSLILTRRINAASAALVINRLPAKGERSPRSEAFRALKVLGVPFCLWEEAAGKVAGEAAAAKADLVIDGITGTGLLGPLRGAAGEMAAAAAKAVGLKAAVDVPSGNFDGWKPGMPIVQADLTLAIEPLKRCLYTPAARPFAGTVIPVEAIFPPALMAAYEGAEEIRWEEARQRVPPIPPDAYKHSRGCVEIQAGAPGYAGAPRIAARGAQAAGAGLIRLILDDDLYPVLAANAGGVIVMPRSAAGGRGFPADAVLLGPGWGRRPDRRELFEAAAREEERGVPLIIDADAIALAKGRVFYGNAVITPHAGELADYGNIPKEELLEDPVPFITACARDRNLTVLFKSHVLYIAAPDGRLGIADGMTAVLGAGGTGDLLGGICAAIAARMKHKDSFDGYTCAAIAAVLLAELGREAQAAGKFTDPLELADIAAVLAGRAWLRP